MPCLLQFHVDGVNTGYHIVSVNLGRRRPVGLKEWFQGSDGADQGPIHCSDFGLTGRGLAMRRLADARTY